MDIILAAIMVIFSFLVSSIPILFYIWFVWWLDHHDREPLILIAVAFFWGAIASIIISIILELIFSIPLVFFPEGVQNIASFVVLAPLIEEVVKSLILFTLFFHRRFNRTLDGIVYGAVVGFGFAASENFLYYTSTYFSNGLGIWIIVVILRTMFTSIGHAVFTSITGAGVALMKFSRQRWIRLLFPPLALLTAIVLHSIFNLGAVLTEYIGIGFFIISMLVVGVSLLAVGIIMAFGLIDESNCIKTQLADEIRTGTVTENEYEVISSYLKRRTTSFKILSKHGYQTYRQATRLMENQIDLAFNKDQLNNTTSDIKRKDLTKNINELRDKIRNLRKQLGQAAELIR
jgi:RsiW-degrading membrane proteinase PrsW (M82 family)